MGDMATTPATAPALIGPLTFGETLRQRRAERHLCNVPGCGQPGPVVVMVEENGGFAGSQRRPGELVDLCPGHYQDVINAVGQGILELPEWLRLDAAVLALSRRRFAADVAAWGAPRG